MRTSTIPRELLRQARQAHVAFVLISLPVILAYVVLTPPAWGLDEQVHTARAVQIAQGNMYPDATGEEGHYGGNLPDTVLIVVEHGHTESNGVDRLAPFYDRADIKDRAFNDRIEGAPISEDTRWYDYGTTGPYSPVIYLPAAGGYLVGETMGLSVGTSLELARFAQAAVYVAIGSFSIFLLRGARIRWLVFTVLLLPTSIFQASIITADTFTTAAVVLFFAVTFRLFRQTTAMDRRDLALLAAASCGLMFTKPSYAVLLAVLVFLPRRLFEGWRDQITKLAYVLVPSMAIFAVVSLLGAGYSDSMLVYRPDADLSVAGQIKWILRNPDDYTVLLARVTNDQASGWMQTGVGMMGYNGIAVPYAFTQLSVVMLILASLYGVSDLVKARRMAVTYTLMALVSALTVTTLLYLSFNAVGSNDIEGIQGRYFIPILPFLLTGVAYIVPMRLKMSQRFASVAFPATSATTLLVAATVYFMALF